jgi:hypothetical protein
MSDKVVIGRDTTDGITTEVVLRHRPDGTWLVESEHVFRATIELRANKPTAALKEPVKT